MEKRVRKKYVLTKRREYWTVEEHELFLNALKRYGREWKAIETEILTKTAVQIRSHAQKYFLRLEKAKAKGDKRDVEHAGLKKTAGKRVAGHKQEQDSSMQEVAMVLLSMNSYTSGTDGGSRSPSSASDGYTPSMLSRTSSFSCSENGELQAQANLVEKCGKARNNFLMLLSAGEQMQSSLSASAASS